MADGEHRHDHQHDDDIAYRVKALEEILVAKGLVDPATIDAFVEAYEHKIGPRNGAAVVAKAWSDPAFKARLLQNGTTAAAELGFAGLEGEALRVVENSAERHNVIVCTLCSCYPWPLLGLPPTWYKSLAYRARVVREPRAVLAEFGLEIPAATAVRVWDSTADLRYLVLPRRPAGTDGHDEAALAALVTRDGMIGTAAV